MSQRLPGEFHNDLLKKPEKEDLPASMAAVQKNVCLPYGHKIISMPGLPFRFLTPEEVAGAAMNPPVNLTPTDGRFCSACGATLEEIRTGKVDSSRC